MISDPIFELTTKAKETFPTFRFSQGIIVGWKNNFKSAKIKFDSHKIPVLFSTDFIKLKQ